MFLVHNVSRRYIPIQSNKRIKPQTDYKNIALNITFRPISKSIKYRKLHNIQSSNNPNVKFRPNIPEHHHPKRRHQKIN